MLTAILFSIVGLSFNVVGPAQYDLITPTPPLANLVSASSCLCGPDCSCGRTATPAPVQAGELPALRLAYVRDVEGLNGVVTAMKHEGFSVEDIAVAVHAMRRNLGIKYKDLTPLELREKIHQRNIEKYGDKYGPTIAWFRTRGDSWDDIIAGAVKTGGADLGYASIQAVSCENGTCSINRSNVALPSTVRQPTYTQDVRYIGRQYQSAPRRGLFGRAKGGACRGGQCGR